MTFGELKLEVANYMHRTDLDGFIAGFIEKARTRINRDLRVREMLIQADVTPVTNPFSLPDGFLEMRDMYHLRGNNRITLILTNRKKLNEFLSAVSTDSNPQYYSIDGLAIETRPGGIGIVFTQLFYTEEQEFVSDSDTRLTLDQYPTIWLYAALIEGHSFTQDLELMNSVQEFYVSEVSQANAQSSDAESGAALQMSGASSFL